MTGQEHVDKFSRDLEKQSNDELIATFNSEVENKGWGTARASFLALIQGEFKKREIDYSAIGDDASLSLKSKISLNLNKIVVEKE